MSWKSEEKRRKNTEEIENGRRQKKKVRQLATLARHWNWWRAAASAGWRYCILYSFYGFHFLLERSKVLHVAMARQAKTSLFSGLESVAPTYTHIHTHAHIHQHRYPFQIGVARRQSVLLSEIEIPAPGHLDGCPWVSVCLRSLSVLAGCTWSPKVKLGKISIKKHLSNPQLMLASAKAFTQLAFHWGCVLRSFFSFFSIFFWRGCFPPRLQLIATKWVWSVHWVGCILRDFRVSFYSFLAGQCNFPRIC